jgi:protein TonB
MYRGQSQETTPSLFSAIDGGYPAEGLFRIGRPPKEAAFRLRFGLALLASIALHILLVLLAPGIPYNTAVPARPDKDMLTVSLTSQLQQPVQPVDTFEFPKVLETTKKPESELNTPAAPILPVTPVTPATPAVLAEPAETIAESTAEDAETVQPRDTSPRTSSIQEPVRASGTPVPATDPGVAGVPDAAKIGEEFKVAFMKLLAYPESARRRGVQGTVGLRIVMDADGRILEAKVSQTSGSSILDKSAVAAALATPGPLAGPGRRLELALRVSFEAGQVLSRP